MRVNLHRAEIAITVDVLSMVLNDPDWQELASATDAEWEALRNAHARLLGALRMRAEDD